MCTSKSRILFPRTDSWVYFKHEELCATSSQSSIVSYPDPFDLADLFPGEILVD